MLQFIPDARVYTCVAPPVAFAKGPMLVHSLTKLSLAAVDTPLSSVTMLSLNTRKRPLSIANQEAPKPGLDGLQSGFQVQNLENPKPQTLRKDEKPSKAPSGVFEFPVLATFRWGKKSATRLKKTPSSSVFSGSLGGLRFRV